jgi:hypothetical protein
MSEAVQRRPAVLTADTLTDLARQVQRLSPCHRDPERYHVEKSVIVATLRRLARNAPEKMVQ